MKIVLGGSMGVRNLSASVEAEISSWMLQHHQFLVGDAAGADTAFQMYLSEANYEHVTVFHALEQPRSNIGGWPTEYVDSGLKSRSHAMHSAKDREMILKSESGLMIWDGHSIGTLANIIDLVDQSKPCFVQDLSLSSTLQLLESHDSLRGIRGRDELFVQARKRLHAFNRRKRRQRNVGETLF